MKKNKKEGQSSVQKNKEVKNLVSVKSAHAVSQSDLFEEYELLPPARKVYDDINLGTLVFVIGIPKAGKTTYCENMALSISSGMDEFLGKPIQIENRKTLFISLEEDWTLTTPRRRKQFQRIKNDKELVENYNHNFITINSSFPALFTNDEDWNTLGKTIIESGADVVFIDSLTRTYNGGIEESSKAKEVTMKLRNLIKVLNVTLFVIHHLPKATIDKSLNIFSMAGSRVLSAEVDYIYGVTKTTGGTKYIKEIESRYKRVDEECITFDIDEDQWISVIDRLDEDDILENTKKDKRKSSVNTKPIHDYFKERGTCTTKELKGEFVDNGAMSAPTLNTQLTKLTEAGQIKRTGHGVYELMEEDK
tara:strand:+ start:443 stop:1531 length:1089 start_codon:yes stop_codon:yes gene_type:complete